MLRPRFVIRHEVPLSPFQADVLDLLERCPAGMDARDLAAIFYSDIGRNGTGDKVTAANNIKANIFKIRSKLESTTVTIGCVGDHTYKVLK